MNEEFKKLPTDEKISQTKSNGVKVRCDWDSDQNAKIPAVFAKWPDCYYHVVGHESDDDAAVLWINAEFSPSNALNAIVDADPPIIDVLEDNRDDTS